MRRYVAISAVGTREWQLPRVFPLMDQQFGLGKESLIATLFVTMEVQLLGMSIGLMSSPSHSSSIPKLHFMATSPIIAAGKKMHLSLADIV